MLVLTRMPGQEILIDDEITIRVVAVRGNTVRLGITAPPDMPVYRGEVADLLANQKIPPGTAGRHKP